VENFDSFKTIELHHFSDASEKGYGQCSYIRAMSNSGEISCSFVMGKSRVAPKRMLSIPRLELQAAVLSVKMAHVIRSELKIHNPSEYFWTDSKIVLGYISNEARRFHTFVANRVQTILDHSQPSQWNYVSTKENPADVASRGCCVQNLLSEWLQAPSLLLRQNYATNKCEVVVTENDPEVRKHSCHTALKYPSILSQTFIHFSSWKHLEKFVSVFERKADLDPVLVRQNAEKCIII
jgi:hypothetical protein